MKWTVEKEHEGMTIQEYLQNVHAFSRRILKAAKFDGGEILLNGIPQTVRSRLMAGDVLAIQFSNEQKGIHMKPESLPLSIVHEDADIIVLHKPSGIASIPSLHHPSGTIANGLLGYYEKHSIPYTVHVVTRLDRDTSGLMLIAKHRYSHSQLATSQKAGGVKRKYVAIVEGHLKKRKGTIHQPIGRKEGSIIERTVTESGKVAITHYEVMKESMKHSLLKVELETGRTHQIRVHFSSIGHPLAGDDLYGGSTHFIERQALHCYELIFTHPETKDIIQFHSDLPEDMCQLTSDTNISRDCQSK